MIVQLCNVPTSVQTWNSSQISTDMYRLYGRNTPVNEATRSFVDKIRENILSVDIREKRGC